MCPTRPDAVEYNPFEATTGDMNQRRTTGFLTLDPPVQYFPLFPSTSTSVFHPRTTHAPEPAPPPPARDSLERTLSDVLSSTATGLSPGAKRKKNFKLGTKIDTWWSAVRTSFSVGSPEDRKSVV